MATRTRKPFEPTRAADVPLGSLGAAMVEWIVSGDPVAPHFDPVEPPRFDRARSEAEQRDHVRSMVYVTAGTSHPDEHWTMNAARSGD